MSLRDRAIKTVEGVNRYRGMGMDSLEQEIAIRYAMQLFGDENVAEKGIAARVTGYVEGLREAKKFVRAERINQTITPVGEAQCGVRGGVSDAKV